MFAGKHFAGSPHTGLDLIEDHQRAKLVAEFTHGGKIALRRQDHATFTTDGFGITAATSSPVFAFAERGTHGLNIPERNVTEAREQRHKRLAESGFSGGGQRAQRLTVERATGSDKGKFAAR